MADHPLIRDMMNHALNGRTGSSGLFSSFNWFGLTDAEATALVTPTDFSYPPGDVRRYGADPTGVSDSYSAINSALSVAQQSPNKSVYIPSGTYLIATKIVVPTGITVYGDGRTSILRKGFNGDILELGSLASLQDLAFAGNSASFTGRGVIITAGTNPSGGRQYCRNIRFSDTASYNVEYTADGVGFGSIWDCCEFSIPNNDIYCIRLPTDTGTGNRHFLGCRSVADSLIDINGGVNTNLNACFSGRSSAGGLWSVGLASGSAQSVINGCRLAGGGQTFMIRGTLHTIVGNDTAGDITFDTGTTSNKFLSNSTGAATITDNSGSVGTSANEFDTNVTPYTVTWTAATSNPSLGNGSLNASYTRRGRVVEFSFRLIMGSTTTYGTGNWRFSLPFTSHTRGYIGSAYILDSGTAFLVAQARINEGGATFLEVIPHNTGNLVNATNPITWTTDDELWVTVHYDV